MKKLNRSKKSGPPKKAVKKKAVKKTVLKRAVKKAYKKAVFTGQKERVMPIDLLVNDATFLHDNVLLIAFNNGKSKVVDFSGFFATNNIPYLAKYKSPRYFKSFKIEEGNIVWGRDWDLIFPISKLYTGKV